MRKGPKELRVRHKRSYRDYCPIRAARVAAGRFERLHRDSNGKGDAEMGGSKGFLARRARAAAQAARTKNGGQGP